MEIGLLFVIAIIILSWVYDFYNGANDSANSIATTVSTRVLTPFQAIALAAVLNFAGALFTTEVAKTIGKGIIFAEFMTPMVIMSSVIGAIVWSAFATHKGIPISITHAIVGGIMGAGFTAYGFSSINWAKLNKIILGMIFSPIGGFIGGFLLLLIIIWIFKKLHPARANFIFGKAQILSASFMAFTHGMNDAQNAMGIITAALLAGGFIKTFAVPLWVIIGSAFFIALGTFHGGKRVIKTMGMRIAKIKPVHGFAAETSASLVIFLASLLGIPISTTHVISTAIMGVGSVTRLSAVRWGIVGHILMAWIFTIPAAAISSGIIYYLAELVL